MYNEKLKCWECEAYDPLILKWCTDAAKSGNPEAMFILAEHYLSQGKRGGHTADAAYYMEQAAKLGFPRAALALGQMYQHGWAVDRSWKKALDWYETAKKLGSPEADAWLRALKRQKMRRTFAILAAALCLIGAVLLLPGLIGFLPDGIRVSKDTELILPETTLEFARELNELIAEYDDELVVSGQQSTNRLVLRFNGRGINLSAFPAATVIADEEYSYVIIQFDSEEDARNCLEALKRMNNILFVEMDSYNTSIQTENTAHISSTAPVYTSVHTGFNYYTWGATYMGLDELAAWIAGQSTASVTVAVVDSGTNYHQEFGNRLLQGADLIDYYNSNGWTDTEGHGTHVAGTILDCTQGLDISVLPIRVFRGRQTASTIIAMGIQYAIDEQVDVINLSLGGSCTQIEDDMIRRALDQNIVVVAAAGNEAMDVDAMNICPAHISGCITVSACQMDSNLYVDTNYGASVDVCAPGVDIISYCLDDMLAIKTGTSMAAPHISALAAMMKLYLPNKTPAQIEKYITDYGYNPGNALYYGAGIPLAYCLAGD